MSDVLAKLLEIVPHYAAAVLIAGLVLLGMPSDLASSLGIVTWSITYRPWIVVLTILAGAIVGVRICGAAWGSIDRSLRRRRASRRQRAAVLESLNTLSVQETQLLAYMLFRNQTTVTAPMVNGIIHSLTSKGLLQRGAGAGTVVSWPFTIPPFVWEELQSRRDELLPDELTSRPDFDHEMERMIGSLLSW